MASFCHARAARLVRRRFKTFETICMRKTLLPYRKASGLIRHPNDLPATVPLTLDLELQGPTQVALDMHPNVVVLPGLRQLPGILTGRPPEPMVQFDYKSFGRLDILDETKRKVSGATSRWYLSRRLRMAANASQDCSRLRDSGAGI